MKPRSMALWGLVTILILLLATTPVLAAPPADTPVVHVVRSGENLAVIAARYGLSVWQIAQANGLSNLNLIYVGQSLTIPGRSAAPGGVHTVSYGETLSGIARRYGVSLWDLIQANRVVNANRIYTGQKLTIPAPLPPAALPVVAGESRYYTQTGHWVRFGFLDFFDRYGGVAIFGYPITEEFVENGIVVQYFQRMRLEWYPNNPADGRVQMAPLGRLVHGQVDAPIPATSLSWYALRRYFPETGHSVTFAFLTFFDNRGGLRVFGPPITEEYVENGVTVQYFVNARLEWRPENADPDKVQLGLLGSQVYANPSAPLTPTTPAAPATPPAPGDPVGSFGRLWQDAAVRNRLGNPTTPQQTIFMAEEPFQGGLLLWRQDNAQSYVLYAEGTWQPSTDLWQEGQPLITVIGDPPQGLYVPQRGFGYIWRGSKIIRERLGWAAAPERGYNGLIQGFQRGLMMRSDSRLIYVLYSDGTWQKFPE